MKIESKYESFIHENAFENVEMAAILPRERRVNAVNIMPADGLMTQTIRHDVKTLL